MRTSWILATGMVLAGAQAASAQVFFTPNYGYVGDGYGYGYGYYGGFGPRPAGRYYHGPGISTFYNPYTGYSVGANTGLPWRFGSANGPVQRNYGYGGAAGGVVRYSRSPNPLSDDYYARSAQVPPPSVAEGRGLDDPTSLRNVSDARGADRAPAPVSKPAARYVAPKTKRYVAPVRPMRANGAADWVQN